MRLNFRENNKKPYQNSPRNLQKSRAILIDNAKVLFQLPPAKTNLQKTNTVVNTNTNNSSKPNNNNKLAVVNNKVASNTKSSPENINTAIQNVQINSIQDEPVMEESIPFTADVPVAVVAVVAALDKLVVVKK